MIKELEELQKVFVDDKDVDEETRNENIKTIGEWEQRLISLDAFSSWQDHDVTKQIVLKAKAVYLECAKMLAHARMLTDEQRMSLWAKQDASMWLISLASKNIEQERGQIMKDINTALGL